MKAALPTLAMALTLAGPAHAAEWGERALARQEFLDTNETFNRTTWVGAHNAYSALEWGYFDPNQTHAPIHLLEAGARQMEYDPRKDAGGNLRLCHGVCGIKDKKFNEGLDQIRHFIQANPNAVIFLKLEMDDAYFNTGEKLENRLGDYIYQPRPGRIPEDPRCPGRHGIEPEFLSKADILAEGKNVIVFAGNGKVEECPGSSRFRRWVHVGLEYEGTRWQKQYDKSKNPTESGALYDRGRMTLIHDPNTMLNINGGNSEQVFTRDNVADYMAAGHNVFELYNFHGEEALQGNDVRAEHMVWSWRTNQPNGNGDCAVVNENLQDPRFNDVICSYSLRYACRNRATDAWTVTSGSGHFDGGQATCTQEFGSGVDFAVPTNGHQMADLLGQIDSRGITTSVYVNYHDRSVEDVWQANSPEQHVETTPAVGNNSRGWRFDYRHMIERRLHTGRYLEVTAARIRAQDRVKGLELTFSDGTVLYHGGNSGNYTESLALGAGTRVVNAEICTDRYSGHDRVFYLELITNKGTVISNGTRSGSCQLVTLNHGLMGFHGKGGDSYFYSLGFHTAEAQSVFENLDWRVTNEPIDGFASWTTKSGVQVVSGDFDNDGKADLAAAGGGGWRTQPTAFSRGDGTFEVYNWGLSDFPILGSNASAKFLVGDLNGDGKSDLALAGGSGWQTLPWARHEVIGAYTYSNPSIPFFAEWANPAGAKVLTGDFNGDGKDDLAVTGAPGATTIGVAFSKMN
ncbi:MAG: phosphatidylinositol-specific phospholipase C domain-containing protein [Acidobacteriota bacterium]